MPFEKIYVGKGKRAQFGVRCTCKLDDVIANSYDYKGVKYFTFDVNEMRTPDKYDNTHALVVSKKVDDTITSTTPWPRPENELPEPDPIDYEDTGLPF